MVDPKIPLAQHEADARLAAPGPYCWTQKRHKSFEHMVEWFRDNLKHSDRLETNGIGLPGDPRSSWPRSVVLVAECGNGPNGERNAKHLMNCDPQTMAAFYRVVRAAAAVQKERRHMEAIALLDNNYMDRVLSLNRIAKHEAELDEALEAFEL